LNKDEKSRSININKVGGDDDRLLPTGALNVRAKEKRKKHYCNIKKETVPVLRKERRIQLKMEKTTIKKKAHSKSPCALP